jgi:hypothetical protein
MPARTVGFVVLFIAFAIKGAGCAPAYLAARCTRRGANTGIHYTGRDIIKNRRLRYHPYLYRYFP